MMWWSYLLAAVGITGIWLAGRNNKAGWAIGLGAQLLWLAYAINTRQWGFIITAVAYGFVYGRNWWKWNKADPRLCQYCRCPLPWYAKLVYYWTCSGCAYRMSMGTSPSRPHDKR